MNLHYNLEVKKYCIYHAYMEVNMRNPTIPEMIYSSVIFTRC